MKVPCESCDCQFECQFPDVVKAADEAAVKAALEADREAGLRDMFATAALGAIVSKEGAAQNWAEYQATLAYRYADAMLKVRKENP